MNLRTWFLGTLQTRTALHVGTGSVLNPATDAPLLRGADGLPLVPGSSCKGAMRSASERLLRALGQRACLVFGDDDSGDATVRCLTTTKKDRDLFFKLKRGEADPTERAAAQKRWHLDGPLENFGQHEDLQLKVLRQELCRACQTWGSIFMAGRVRVPDLRLKDQNWPNATEIRDGVGLDRDTGTAADRIKFDLEVLPAGACFDFELIVEPEADLGIVALAVGELLQGSIPLGGRVTRGLGDVALQRESFQIFEVNLAEPAALVRYLTRKDRQKYEGSAAVTKLNEILERFMTQMEGQHAA